MKKQLTAIVMPLVPFVLALVACEVISLNPKVVFGSYEFWAINYVYLALCLVVVLVMQTEENSV
jgi:hypothetical protein